MQETKTFIPKCRKWKVLSEKIEGPIERQSTSDHNTEELTSCVIYLNPEIQRKDRKIQERIVELDCSTLVLSLMSNKLGVDVEQEVY